MYKVVFTKDGVEVQKKEKKALSGGEEWITIERFSWEELPKDNIEMKVTGINYILSDDKRYITKLELIVDYIRRLQPGPKLLESDDVLDAFWNDVERELGIKKEENGDITLNPQKSAKQNLVDFVKYLFKRGYLRKSDLPVSSGYKRYLLNTEPVHKDGTKMRLREEIEEGVYLETHFGVEAIKDKIKKLAEEYVLRKST